MNSQYLIILISLIFPLPASLSAKANSSCDRGVGGVCDPAQTDGRNHGYWTITPDVEEGIKPQRDDDDSLDDEGETTDLQRSAKGQLAWHHRRRLRNVHGILNIIGWGTLLPVGVIIARSFRKSPMRCEEWHNLHILCQTLGYIVGAIGWGFGIWLGNSSKHYTFQTHRVLGIIIFTLASIQIMLALCFQHKRGAAYCRCWEIYHKVVGSALIAMIIANVFEGISNRGHAAQSQEWKWAYLGILVVLAFVAIVLEILRCVKVKTQQRIGLEF
ncbi:hypothetical protein Tsubulata_013391 [Turnera subulata]|uniref:Cytochrome b561 domain-containing protein n=1 Tax=Turnera subulata TaxID=218843 RepID=A0A9Q0G6J4_9ROSI|nr:hypothetical protein Tsubulata_013391 [Turnera subulata]